MTKQVVRTVLAAFALPCLAFAQDEKPAPLASAIVEVTVYADRARITRRADLALPAGPALLAAEKLPGWIDETSVRVTVTPADGIRIADVRLRREYLAKTDDEDLRKDQAAAQALRDQLADLDDELKVLDEQTKQVEAIKAFSLDKLPRDVATRDVPVETYGKAVDFVGESLRKLGARRREAQRKRRDLQPELASRERQLHERLQRGRLEQSRILIALEAPAPVKATLTLTYLLPGATWEPAHELRATGEEPAQAALSSFAVVTQTTGEDWAGALLTFSTQSSTETIRIPELDSLLVGGGRAMASWAGGANNIAFDRAASRYRAQSTGWYLNFNPQESAQVLASNAFEQTAVQDRSAAVFQKLQTRGTTAHFQGRGRPAVRSDGRSVRVPIGDVRLACAQRIAAAPEVSLNAARTLHATNTSGQALLPAGVSLYHDGAFLGMTEIDFVAEAEAFAVFLGVADQIKVSRALDRSRSRLTRGRRTEMQVAFDVAVENLSDRPVALALADRVPVSEDRDIRVESVRLTPSVRPDSKGLVRWDVALAPRQKQVFRIEYCVDYPSVPIADLKKAKESLSPAAPADASVYDQIRRLEKAF